MTPAIAIALLLAAPRLAPAVIPPTPDPRPTIPVMQVHLPISLGWPPRVATSAPRPTAADLRTTLRPATSAALAAALQVPGALVLPVGGEYRQAAPFRVAAGVTLDGRGLVTVRGGLRLQRADGARILGVAVNGSADDAIGIDHTGGTVVIERVTLTGAADGCLDVVRSVGQARVYVVDTVLHDCRKAMLLGHYDPGQDAALVVHLERVIFRDNDARNPKVHRAAVTMRDSRVIRWGSRAVDAQLGARVTLYGVRFDEGPMSGPRIRLESGGTVTEAATVFVPYRPEVGSE